MGQAYTVVLPQRIAARIQFVQHAIVCLMFNVCYLLFAACRLSMFNDYCLLSAVREVIVYRL